MVHQFLCHICLIVIFSPIRFYLHNYLREDHSTCIHTFIHIHTYTHSVGACVTKTVGYGKSNKYTNTRNFYSVKYYKHFTQQEYCSIRMEYLKAMLSTLSVTADDL